MQEITTGFPSFVAIVEAGSISAAARELGVPRETLSRQLAQLEERLGVRLLHRGTRMLVLTSAGQTLFARARPLVAAAREAEAAVRLLDDVPRGRLRVSTPPNSGANLLGEMLSAFLVKYPQVELEVLSTSRFVDLVGEGVDVALRAGGAVAPELVSRRLWSSTVVAVAAPSYLAARGVPQTLQDLSGHSCLLGMEGGGNAALTWPTPSGGRVPVQGRLVSNDLSLLLTAVEAGLGIGLLPWPFVRPRLEAGQLSLVLVGQVGAETSMSLVFVERRLMAPRLRAFIDHTTAWFETRDLLPLGPLASS